MILKSYFTILLLTLLFAFIKPLQTQETSSNTHQVKVLIGEFIPNEVSQYEDEVCVITMDSLKELKDALNGILNCITKSQGITNEIQPNLRILINDPTPQRAQIYIKTLNFVLQRHYIELKLSQEERNKQKINEYIQFRRLNYTISSPSRVLSSTEQITLVITIVSVIAGSIFGFFAVRFLYRKCSKRGGVTKQAIIQDKGQMIKKEENQSTMTFAIGKGLGIPGSNLNFPKGMILNEEEDDENQKDRVKFSKQQSHRSSADGKERKKLPQNEDVPSSGQNETDVDHNMFMNMTNPDSVHDVSQSSYSDENTPKHANFKIEFSMVDDTKVRTDRVNLMKGGLQPTDRGQTVEE